MFFFFEDVGVPSFDKMMIPVLQALQQLGGSAKVSDLDSQAIEIMDLPKEVTNILHKGSTRRTEVAYRLAWARTYLKKYGLLKNTTRGIWSFTGKIPKNIDDIDIDKVIKSVRRGNEELYHKSFALTGFENALAFEQFAFAFIKDIVKQQGKSYYLTYSDAFDFGYDVVLPQGIDSIEDDVYCVIKYVQSRDKGYSVLTDSAIRVAHNIQKGVILLLVGGEVTSNEKSDIEKKVTDESDVTVIIWDNREIASRVDPESDYASYLINPKHSLADSAILSETTDEEKQLIKSDLIDRVRTEFRNENITLFLGAGVSMDAGIPLWDNLIKKLLIDMINSKLKGRRFDKKSVEALNTLAYSNKEESPITQMRYIRDAFTDDEYFQFVHNALYQKKINIETKLLDAISGICKPQRALNGVRGIVTYNFDDIIEQVFRKKEIEFNTIYRNTDMPSLDKLNIFHVHGFLPQHNSISYSDTNLIFSEEDYHRTYSDVYSWSNLTQLNAFRDSTCLFIGCSFTDPNLRRLLDAASRMGESARHFAFMKKKVINNNNDGGVDKDVFKFYQNIDDNIREAHYRKFGINVIWVNEHTEIPIILQSIQVK